MVKLGFVSRNRVEASAMFKRCKMVKLGFVSIKVTSVRKLQSVAFAFTVSVCY